MSNLIDETGNRHGRLTVIERAGSSEYSQTQWLCRCECGKDVIVTGNKLRTGHTQSCGCLQRDRASQASIKHGLSKTSEYNIWASMRSRCRNPNHKAFHLYGGRGITIDSRWDDFGNFLDDMGKRPGPNYSLDRRDNDGMYSSANCRWATSGQQARNYRRNHFLTHDGITMCLTDWAARLGLCHQTLGSRLHRGWPTARALFEPVHSKHSCRKQE